MNTVDKTINNNFEQLLIDSGYHFFKDNWKNSIRGIQKEVNDNKGVKYFITAYHYNLHKQYPNKADSESEKIDRYNFNCQFTQKTKENCFQTIDVSFSADFIPNPWKNSITSLKEVEDFFEKMFIDFKFEYYEKY